MSDTPKPEPCMIPCLCFYSSNGVLDSFDPECPTHRHEVELRAILATRDQRIEELEQLIRIADVHIGWGDCTLENVHRMLRAALAPSEPEPAK
jgi:hypothetical protein